MGSTTQASLIGPTCKQKVDRAKNHADAAAALGGCYFLRRLYGDWFVGLSDVPCLDAWL
jgi:hypothetical protein